MEKISTTTRYAEDYNGLHVEADVQKNEKTGEITAVNGGNVHNEDYSLNAWFNIQGDGQLNIGGIKADDKENVSKVTEAVVNFYKEVKAL